MWIKTADGELLNVNSMTDIEYDKESDVTVARFGVNHSCRIAEGDVTQIIATAIMKNQTFMGVH